MHRYLVVTVDHRRYGIDVLRVCEVVHPDRAGEPPVLPDEVAMVDLRAPTPRLHPTAVVVCVDGRTVALLVDEAGDVVDPDDGPLPVLDVDLAARGRGLVFS